MRISSVLFLSLFSIQALHAQGSPNSNSALSELEEMFYEMEDVTSEWDHLLQLAESKTFKKADPDFEYECAFPDAPEYGAPGWVCDEPIAGFDITAVGSGYGDVPLDRLEKVYDERGYYSNRVDAPIKAYIDAMVMGQAMIKVSVANKVREHSNEDDVKIKEDEVSKQITSVESLSGNTRLNQMFKNYVEYDENGNKIASVSSSVAKLVYQSNNCKAIIKIFSQVISETEVEFEESKVSRGLCGFHQIVEDMGESEWQLLDMIKSPRGVYYVLVGHGGSVAEQIEINMENEQALWEQFKAQQDAE